MYNTCGSQAKYQGHSCENLKMNSCHENNVKWTAISCILLPQQQQEILIKTQQIQGNKMPGHIRLSDSSSQAGTVRLTALGC